ncbi:hypothetical protein [Burkholderia glumae]|uniref:Uncharacterized protein n=1 Tax=Burkholderia glumae TaxID=337 RepID=A0AAP9XXL6_BURGL|nr:hypothetical protein [Burkholderia glumae]MCM2485151.1 hypothetical protein [Burkholderia glumae]MCM2510846.1 hypothetical protein [Burkholderia glumae]MCM2540674.1 hypothetical protein [Burkholderia glumae]MCM2549282.1 hypothetical protein [Burkholderia glumae]NVE24843.1 hypothetical protein [Burkholderia glumae]
MKRTLSSRIQQLTAYDPAGRMERQMVQRHHAPEALSARRYHHDTAGQFTQIEDNRPGAVDYRYDPISRLIEAIGPGRPERRAAASAAARPRAQGAAPASGRITRCFVLTLSVQLPYTGVFTGSSP